MSSTAGTPDLDDVIAAVHDHDATGARHRSRMLATLQLAAERRPGVFSALRGYLVKNLPVLVAQALEDPDGELASALDSALVFCGERADPGLELGLACAHLQMVVPLHHERGAQLLYTAMRLALPPVRALAEHDPDEGLDVLHLMLHQLVLRSEQAGRHAEALEWNLESVQVRRQLADRDSDKHVAELSFDLSNLASAHMHLGQSGEALAAAEEAVTLSRELTEPGKGTATGLAIALHRLSGIHADLGNFAQAQVCSDAALPVLEQRADQGDSSSVALLAAALGHQGAILAGQHQYEQALVVTTEVVRLREGLAEESPDAGLALLAIALHNLSQVKTSLGRHDDALTDAARAVEVSRAVCAANPRRHRITLIRHLNLLSELHLRLAQSEQAVTAVEEAVTLGRCGTEADLAESLRQLLIVLMGLGRYADALPVCSEAEALLRRLVQFQPHLRALLASTMIDLSQVLDDADRLDEALDAAREALAFARQVDAPGNLTLARALVNLGDRYASLRYFPEALVPTAEGVELLRTADQPAALADALTKLADRHAHLDRLDAALVCALEAVLVCEAGHWADLSRYRITYASALRVLSQIHWSLRRPQDGLPCLTQAVRLYRELAETDASDYHRASLASALHTLAALQGATYQYHEAVDSCRQGNQIYQQLADTNEDHYLGRYAGSLQSLCAALSAAGRLEDALNVARRQVAAARRLATKSPVFHEFLAHSHSQLTELLTSLDDRTEA